MWILFCCSFLKEEWNYLKQEVSPSDLPIADRIWQHLPRRIDDRIIPVNLYLKYVKLGYCMLTVMLTVTLTFWIVTIHFQWHGNMIAWMLTCLIQYLVLNLTKKIYVKFFDQVPQQKNDYDCGLFVLFFMERFMEEAPERLKKKDLAMVLPRHY